MKKGDLFFPAVLFIVIVFMSCSVKAADWRFPVGLSYVSSFSDIVDLYEDNLEAENLLITESVESLPVGISFHPYVQLNAGLGVGFGVGPLMMIMGDTDFLDLPVKLNLRYTIIPRHDTSPYIYAGLSHHAASGEYVEDSSSGVCGGVGVEFFRNKVVGMGIELSFDSAEIEFEKLSSYSSSTTEKIKPCETMFSVFAVF